MAGRFEEMRYEVDSAVADMDFTGKTAVVTGAASGIGRAAAQAMARRGATVIGADRDGHGLKETAAAHRSLSGYELDLARPDQILAFADEVTSRHGAADILINAAGWDRVQPFTDNDDAFWIEVAAINFLGTVRMTHAFLRAALDRGAAPRIVNVASDAGRVGSSGESVYAGAKGGVIAFTKSIAREMARHGITANCVCPGPTDTPLFRDQPERIKEALTRAIPFRRIARPEEVADAIVFFASDRAAYVTGQVLSVSGGLTMAG